MSRQEAETFYQSIPLRPHIRSVKGLTYATKFDGHSGDGRHEAYAPEHAHPRGQEHEDRDKHQTRNHAQPPRGSSSEGHSTVTSYRHPARKERSRREANRKRRGTDRNHRQQIISNRTPIAAGSFENL